MKISFFRHATGGKSEKFARTYSLYELGYTGADFLAALMFVIGSILFFGETTQRAGTWLFLVGSLFFALKPSLRLAREIHLWRIGKMEELAERARREA